MRDEGSAPAPHYDIILYNTIRFDRASTVVGTTKESEQLDSGQKRSDQTKLTNLQG